MATRQSHPGDPAASSSRREMSLAASTIRRPRRPALATRVTGKDVLATIRGPAHDVRERGMIAAQVGCETRRRRRVTAFQVGEEFFDRFHTIEFSKKKAPLFDLFVEGAKSGLDWLRVKVWFGWRDAAHEAVMRFLVQVSRFPPFKNCHARRDKRGDGRLRIIDPRGISGCCQSGTLL